MSFPCLISIPHGGVNVPPEVKGLFLLTQEDILRDGDPFTGELYDLPAASVIRMDIARAVVDVNRAPDDLPPHNPDGVVKSHTCYGKKVYREPLTGELIRLLLEKFYIPYHNRIREALEGNNVLLAFDCHSMAPYPPPGAGNRSRRPAFCLGDNHGKACRREVTELLARCLREVFDLPEREIALNRPFAGGYITRTYGGKPKFWIQIEIRRDLYMDWDNLRKREDFLKSTREKIGKAMSLFFERVSL